MIEIVKSPSSDIFYDLVGKTTSQLYLCAPYIKKEVVKKILDIKNKTTTLNVFTSANVANFVNGSSDVEAIKMLIDSGIEVINYQRLHAKIYLFDDKKALVTSANLTNYALYKNYEYGVLIHEDEKTALDQIYNDFVEMLSSELKGQFDKENIKTIIEVVKDFKGKGLTKIDESEDELLPVKKASKLTKYLSPWQKDVFNCIVSIPNPVFLLSDVNKFVPALKAKHPKNNNVEAKIRQILQQLRDIGFIKFIERGKYKKLWCIL